MDDRHNTAQSAQEHRQCRWHVNSVLQVNSAAPNKLWTPPPAGRSSVRVELNEINPKL